MEFSLGPARASLPLDTPMNPDDLLVTVSVEVYQIPGKPGSMRMRLASTGIMKLSARETHQILHQAVKQLRAVQDVE